MTTTVSACKECYYCGFETDTKEYSVGLGEKRELCFICANTRAGNFSNSPRQPSNEDILKTACQIGNIILKKIQEDK